MLGLNHTLVRVVNSQRTYRTHYQPSYIRECRSDKGEDENYSVVTNSHQTDDNYPNLYKHCSNFVNK